MILVKFMERITEYEFDHFYVFKDYTKDAYDKEKITEEKLLRDFFSGVADKPQFNPFSKEKDWWRFGETIITKNNTKL